MKRLLITLLLCFSGYISLKAHNQYVRSIKTLPNGNLLMGISYMYDEYTMLPYLCKGWVMITDSVGNELGSYQSAVNERITGAYDVIATSDGGYAFCGEKVHKVLSGSAYLMRYQPYICKLNANLEKEWDYTFRDTAYTASLVKIIELPDSGFIAGGRFSRPSNNLGLVVKVNKLGELTGYQAYAKRLGNNPYDRCIINDLVLLEDGSLVGCGESSNSGMSASVQSQFAWLFKTDSMGCLEDSCEWLTFPLTSLEENGLDKKSETFYVFPNPAQNLLYVNHSELVLSYRLFQLDGKMIKQGDAFPIQLDDLANGIYFIRLMTKENKPVNLKFVKRE
jgi:hypothetical protein